MRTPLKTRDGYADAPIEPGLRMLCEPCVTGPRWKLWRLIVPWKPLPMPMPADLDLVAGLEELDGDVLALHGVGEVAAELDEMAVRAVDAGLREVAALGLRDLAVGDRLPRELDGLVAVGVRRADGDDRARAGLDDGDRRDAAALLVEELRHAELLSDDSAHRLELDLDVDAGREVEPHERVDRLRRRASGCRSGACACAPRSARASPCP